MFERYPVDEDNNVGIFKGEQQIEFKHQYNIDVDKFTYIFDIIIMNEAFKDSKECKIFQKGLDSDERGELD